MMDVQGSQGSGKSSLFPFQSLTLQVFGIGGGSGGNSGRSKVSLVKWSAFKSRDTTEGGAYESRAVGGKKSAVLAAEDALITNSTRGKLSIAGLANLGNTCFMNSILQCLMHTRPLLNYCVGGQYKTDINKQTSCMKGQLISAYVKVMEGLASENGKRLGGDLVYPHEFKSQIARFAKRFLGNSQHDAHEFLMYLLEGLHEDLNKSVRTSNKNNDNNNNKNKRSNGSVSSNGSSSSSSSSSMNEEETLKARPAWQKYREQHNSKIIDIFVGQLKSSLTCCRCGHSSDTFEPFLDLSLPIGQTGGAISLLDCLQLFLQVEELTGEDCPTCSRCKCRRECTKRFSIEKFPQVLIIHLKRFSHGLYSTSKLCTTVKCPHSLNLSNFTSAAPADSSPAAAASASSAATAAAGSARASAAASAVGATLDSTAATRLAADDDDEGRISFNAGDTCNRVDRLMLGEDCSSSQVTYRLYAVSNHSGSTHGGHYTASARHPSTGIWHYFNDSRVSLIDESKVVTSDAYILLYELVETTTSRL